MSQRNLDVHLLECFDMLMRERSVSRAAERLGISQSSTSESLAKLRERLSDPLLVRSRDGMVPTPRALELLPQIRQLIEGLHTLLNHSKEFDAAQLAMRFRLATSDYTQLLLMPGLCRRIQVEAPKCGLDILPTHLLRVEEALGAAELDLAIAYYPEPPQGLRCLPLFSDEYVCIARPGHPGMGAPMSAVDFAALSHISVAPSGLAYFSGVVDSALQALGLTRRVTISSPHFLLAAHLVTQSDLVLVLPRQAANNLSQMLPLQILELPIPTRPVQVAMYWHERTHHSKPHQWLRSMVRTVLAPAGALNAQSLHETHS